VVAATTLLKATWHKAILVASGPRSRLLNFKHLGARWGTSGTHQAVLRAWRGQCLPLRLWQTPANHTTAHPGIGEWPKEETASFMHAVGGD